MNMPMPIKLLEALHSATGPLMVTDEERQRSFILLLTEAFARLHGYQLNEGLQSALAVSIPMSSRVIFVYEQFTSTLEVNYT